MVEIEFNYSLFTIHFSLFFVFRRDVFLWMLFVEVALDGIEDAVDELCGFVGREATGDFERFVDGDGARRRLMQEFIDGEAQDVAINDSHARDAPVLSARLDP